MKRIIKKVNEYNTDNMGSEKHSNLISYTESYGLMATAKLVDKNKSKNQDYTMTYLTWEYTDFDIVIPKRYLAKAKEMVINRKNKSGWEEAVKYAYELVELFFSPTRNLHEGR